MGGKKNQAQRTKNNVKPSSSGRTADLISDSLNPKTISLQASNLTSTLTNSVLFDLYDPRIDPNFVVVFKKMGKKDPISRHKALHEFVTLCDGTESNVLVDLLPTWIRFYSTLTVDVEHRIREAAQFAHKAIAGKVGRNLAPFLKQIVPLWYIAQFDTHAPAASAAALAFKGAFPPHKLMDVTLFCQEEIIGYIAENISSENAKSKMPDDQEKQERIIVSSLNGYSHYISQIPSDKLSDLNNLIISSSSYWKLQKNKSGLVRGAWFSNLTALMKHAPFLLGNHEKNIANAVFHSIDDNDPVALPKVWETALYCVTTIENVWTYINVDKMFKNKLCNVIKQGGQGSATMIFPNIVLLLSKLPSESIKDKNAFYGQIFSSFQQGMMKPICALSPGDSEAIVTSYNECLRYLIMMNIEDHLFCELLINDHVSPLFLKMIMESVHRLQIRPFFMSFMETLLNWERNARTDERYSKCFHVFFDKLCVVCTDSVEKCIFDQKALESLFENHNILISSLNCSGMKRRKKKQKVHFEEEPNDKKLVPAEEKESFEEDQLPELVQKNVLRVVDELSKTYFSVALKQDNVEIKALAIKQLWQFSKMLNSRQVNFIVNKYDDQLRVGIRSWINDDSVPLKYSIGLLFNFVDAMEVKEKRFSFISGILANRINDALLEAIYLAASEESDKETLISWLQSQDVKDRSYEVFKNLVGDSNTATSVLRSCILTTNSGDVVLNDLASVILAVLIEHLRSGTKCLEFIGELKGFLFGTHAGSILGKHKDKIFCILELCLRAVTCGENVELMPFWTEGVESLVECFGIGNVDVLDFFKNSIKTLCEVVSGRKVEVDVENSLRVLLTIQRLTVGCTALDSTDLFINFVFNEAKCSLEKTLEQLCWKADFINCRSTDCFLLANEDESTAILLDDVSFESYVKSLVVVVKYLAVLSGATLMGDIYEDDNLATEITPIENIVSYLSTVAYALSISKLFIENYSSLKIAFTTGHYVLQIEPVLKEIVQRCDADKQKLLVELIEFRLHEKKGLWNKVKDMILYDMLDEQRPRGVPCEAVFDLDVANFAQQLFDWRRHGFSNYSDQTLKEMFLKTIEVTKDLGVEKKQSRTDNRNQLLLRTEAGLLTVYILEKKPEFRDELPKFWDFVMLSLASWFKDIAVAKPDSSEYLRFVTSTCELLRSFADSVLKRTEADQPKIADIRDEWENLFHEEVFFSIANAWESLADKTTDFSQDYLSIIHINALCTTFCYYMDRSQFNVVKNDEKRVLKLLKMSLNCILSSHCPIQVTAWRVMRYVSSFLVKIDSAFDEDSLNKLTCQLIQPKLLEAQSVVTTMLQDINFGISCTVAPFTDSYTYTLGYMLLCSQLLDMCRIGSSQLRYIYTLWIKENDIVIHFVQSVLKLMPDSVCRRTSNSDKWKGLFANQPCLIPSNKFTFDFYTSQKLSHLSCYLYCEILRTLPAVARQCISDFSDSKTMSFIDKLTTTYVSSLLCEEEMKALKDQHESLDSTEFQLVTQEVARQVIAIYTFDDIPMELVITLAPNHPLRPPTVELSKTLKTTKNQQWSMQLNIFLTHQNGTIWDGLMLWKSNLDKRFEGVEECYICFSIIHNSSHQLPKISCQKCKKKFHSFCLYKWFTTSNKSACPICRTHF